MVALYAMDAHRPDDTGTAVLRVGLTAAGELGRGLLALSATVVRR